MLDRVKRYLAGGELLRSTTDGCLSAHDGSECYSGEFLSAQLSDVSVDLLVVGGPPGHTEATRSSR